MSPAAVFSGKKSTKNEDCGEKSPNGKSLGRGSDDLESSLSVIKDSSIKISVNFDRL